MATEVERKFLVIGDSWRQGIARQESLRQGYLVSSGRSGPCSVRVRIQGDEAFLNIKEAVAGRERLEFEYGIPVDDGLEMLQRLVDGPLVEKTRYWVEDCGATWEIDVFHGENAGLIVAELELETVDESVPQPDWLGREVTDEKRYYNVALSERPYSKWSEQERS